jgi:uncharacterized membrane protein YjjP (DUF1212 family)
MIFGILFILAFLLGLVVYLFSNQWWYSVGIATALFVATTLADTQASQQWGITFIFGIPIVFVASLLGAYIVEWRRGYTTDSDEPPHDPSV